jgi:hypothetical protein
VAVFVDHPEEGFWSDGYPSLRNLAAVTFGPTWNDALQAIEGGIRFYSSADWLCSLLDELLSDQAAGKEVPDVGLSLVFYGKKERKSDGTVVQMSIDHVESCDIVFGPAAEGRVRAALSKAGVNLSPNPSPERGGERIAAHNGGEPMSEETKLAQPPVVVPPAEPKLDDLVDQVERLTQIVSSEEREKERVAVAALATKVNELAAVLGKREEETAVKGMGAAPADRVAAYFSARSSLEQFRPVVDWLFGVQGAPLPDPQFRRADGIYWALTGDFELRGMFDRERVMLTGATTSTLPGMAVDAMNKVMMAQFSALTHWRWFERVVMVAPNDGSLQSMKWITYGGIANIPTVSEGGVYTELSVGDAKESDAFVKKGGYVGITREMIKNSDILRIQAVPRALAIAALRTRSAAVSALFTDNAGVGPTLDQDAKALFHTDHGNLGTTAFSAAEWAVVRTAVFKHAELTSSKKLGVFPRFALLPADLYDSALTAFGYGEGYPTTYSPYSEDRGNEDPRPVPLVVPDWTDADNWAAIVDPAVFPVIMMTYSQRPGGGGHPAPELLFSVVSEESGLMFTNDTLPIKVRDEFAVGVNGPRGVYKENV